MKKIALLFGIALGLGFTACDEFDLPNPPGQSNPEEPAFNSANLEIMQAAETLDLNADNEASKKVTLANITKLVDFPASYELLFEMELSRDAEFTDPVILATEINDTTLVQIEPSALNSAIYNNFTKDPAEIELYARLAAYAKRGDTKMRLGDTENYWYGNNYRYIVTPFVPAKVIENQYYLLERAIGSTSWNVTAALPFSKTSDQSVYDNPVFQIKIDVADAGTEWAVLPASSFDAAKLDGIMGVSDATAMEGALAEGENFVAGKITEASPYTITINVEEMSYKVALAFDYLWVPGQATSSTPSSKRVKRIATNDYITYAGAIRLRNEWFLTGQPSFDGVVYTLGSDESNKPVIDEKTGVETGHIVNDRNGIKMVADDGFYYLSVNLGTLTYKTSPINTISAIGEFNGWDTASAPELTHDKTYQTWTIENVEMTEGSEFKFCVNHDWVISFGGAYDNLVQNGGNLKVPGEAGPEAKTYKYDIKLDFSEIPNTCTLIKK